MKLLSHLPLLQISISTTYGAVHREIAQDIDPSGRRRTDFSHHSLTFFTLQTAHTLSSRSAYIVPISHQPHPSLNTSLIVVTAITTAFTHFFPQYPLYSDTLYTSCPDINQFPSLERVLLTSLARVEAPLKVYEWRRRVERVVVEIGTRRSVWEGNARIEKRCYPRKYIQVSSAKVERPRTRR